MDSLWIGLALPFGMIGFWVAVGMIELLRTPTPPRDSVHRQNRVTAVSSVGQGV